MTTVIFCSGYSFPSSCCISYKLAVGVLGWEHKLWSSLGFSNHWILNTCHRNIFQVSPIKIQKYLFSLIWLESRLHLLPKNVSIKPILHCLSYVQPVATRPQVPLHFYLTTDIVHVYCFCCHTPQFSRQARPNYRGNSMFLLPIRIYRTHTKSIKILLFPAVQV